MTNFMGGGSLRFILGENGRASVAWDGRADQSRGLEGRPDHAVPLHRPAKCPATRDAPSSAKEVGPGGSRTPDRAAGRAAIPRTRAKTPAARSPGPQGPVQGPVFGEPCPGRINHGRAGDHRSQAVPYPALATIASAEAARSAPVHSPAGATCRLRAGRRVRGGIPRNGCSPSGQACPPEVLLPIPADVEIDQPGRFGDAEQRPQLGPAIAAGCDNHADVDPRHGVEPGHPQGRLGPKHPDVARYVFRSSATKRTASPPTARACGA